jgi:hypothetical protein
MTIRKIYQFIFMVVLAAAALLLVKPAQADSIIFQLSNPVQSVVSGGTVDFYATVSAPLGNATTIYLNSDDNGVAGPLSLNDDGFWNNFFPLSIDPGQSYTDLLFTVTVPFGTYGAYDGYFTIYGGSDFSSDGLLATAPFEVDVPTPEPGSVWLFSIGLLALAFVAGRKRFQTNE